MIVDCSFAVSACDVYAPNVRKIAKVGGGVAAERHARGSAIVDSPLGAALSQEVSLGSFSLGSFSLLQLTAAVCAPCGVGLRCLVSHRDLLLRLTSVSRCEPFSIRFVRRKIGLQIC